jgi:polyisoprenoid-binding protein YceI
VARYAIAPEQSTVWIDASSSVHPIHSRTVGLEGWIDLEAPPRGHLELPVAKLVSGNSLLDREMRRRVDARRHPTISGELLGLEDVGDGRHRTRGEVTFRGVTRPVDGELTITLDGGTMRITGERTFDIREFGMEPPKILMLKVHPEVSVRIDILAARQD